MPTVTISQRLAQFAHDLGYEDIPVPVRSRATVTTMYTAYRLNDPNEMMPPHKHTACARSDDERRLTRATT